MKKSLSAVTLVCRTAGISSALALAGAAAAVAQEQPSSQQATTLDEVVVTAQRRSERLQDVPISIQAVTTEMLQNQGIQNTRDLTSAVPGLNFTVKGAFAQPTLRGISSQGVGPGVDPAVPIYVDGVYQANTIASAFELADVSGIEVLKGPQGTLYGRNATGGAILISTLSPSFEPGGQLTASYGNYNDRRIGGYVTAPLVADVLAVSLAGFYHERDSYTEDLLRGGDAEGAQSSAVRGKVLFQPNERVKFVLAAMHAEADDPSPFYGVPLDGNSLSKRVAPTLPITTEPFTIRANEQQALDTRVDSVQLNASIDFDFGTLSSITAYTDSEARVVQDSDAGPGAGLSLLYFLPSETKSQEFSLATRSFGIFSVLAGALYYEQDASGNLVANRANDILGIQKTEAYAVYAEGTAEITPALTVVAGLRYSDESRDYTGLLATYQVTPYATIARGQAGWDALTPRLSIKYAFSDALNVYATYNKGFKSGVFNPSGLSSTPVNPETVTAYEAGVKYATGRVRLNAALYSYDYADVQVASTVTLPSGATASVLQNAASASIIGFDVDGAIDFGQGFSLSGGLSYLDGQYDRFPSATVNVPFPVSACPVGTYPCGNRSIAIDASGNPLARAPDLTGNATAQYSAYLPDGELTSSLSLYYNSGFAWEVGNRVKQGSYATLAANVVWRPNARPFEISAFVRNITDEVYAVNEADSAGGDIISFGPPRTFGVQVKWLY